MSEKAAAVKDNCRLVIAALFLLFIGACFLLNIRLPYQAVVDGLKEEQDVKQIIQGIASSYVSDGLTAKTDFIELNGMFSKLCGRRIVNERIKLNNGMMTFDYSKYGSQDMRTFANNLIQYATLLKTNYNIPFVYIQAPDKIPLEENLLPYDIPDQLNSDTDSLLQLLDAANISYYDLRTTMSSTKEQVEKNFFYTDHHWNLDGAFYGYQTVMTVLQDVLGNSLDLSYTSSDMWERKVVEDWFLGSHGKRVGSMYAGVDDVIYYTPKFDTNMSCIIPIHNEIYKGDFAEANLRSSWYLEKRDLYKKDCFCLYVGGLYPIVQHRNADAPNKLKVLLIKDSFSLPLECFLAAEFTEVDTLDPRYYTDSIAKYTAESQPDIVIMLLNSGQFPGKLYEDLGTEGFSYLKYRKNVLVNGTVHIDATDNDYNSYQLPVDLEPGRTYRLYFEKAVVTGEQPAGISLMLLERNEWTVIERYLFDLSYCNDTETFEWYFTVPTDNPNGIYQISIYAGLDGETHDKGLEINNIQINEFD